MKISVEDYQNAKQLSTDVSASKIINIKVGSKFSSFAVVME